MNGWKTRTFTDKVCLHHRAMGTAQHGSLAARFRTGAKDYAFGNHPVWELFRTFYQMTKKPFVIGGLSLASGYLWSMIRRAKRPVSDDVVVFTRGEQMRRLEDSHGGVLSKGFSKGLTQEPATDRRDPLSVQTSAEMNPSPMTDKRVTPALTNQQQ